MPITEVLNPNDSLVSSRSFKVRSIEDGAELTLALPGVDRDQLRVRVTVSDIIITILGSADFSLLTRSEFKFCHQVKSPTISAKIKNGLLVVQLRSNSFKATEVTVE